MTHSPASFDDATENFTDWVRLHATQVALGVGAVVIIGGGLALWRSSANSRAHRAEAALFEAQAPLAEGNIPAAQQQLQQVAQRYDGTAGGTQAQLALAETYYDQGKYQEGLNVLKQADDAPKAMQNAVRHLTAVGYEGLGKFEDAAKLYEQAVGDAATDSEKHQLQAEAARAYQNAGKNDQALRLWTDLAKIEGQGLSDEARVRVGELTAKRVR
ncbi:Tetratricopeptide repeat-containing protein [Gemmatirosa kalamazoonensis]|uniref:Tetratricopeptide repeat-containing protein n=1 Tax=Gemmatirosa kalamazoonensis TaxID=861299 RepID=W0RKD8_9BACT|nr:tetratricopeptide repeat protein [Gemmatirosa kalamazoonensis]AHG90780.1 Tetratricopeptide repeat-containing protein [Gemmatirosa kalamazoonensis]